MQPDREDGDDAARADLLRRRLYRAGATEEDVRRYLAERAARPEPAAASEVARPPQPDPEAPAAAAEAPSPSLAVPSRPPRRALLGGVIALTGAGALAAVTALVRFDGGTTPVAAPTGSTRASSRPASGIVEDIGEGQVLTVERGSAPVPVRAATSVRGVAAVGLRYEGRGNAVVSFDPPTGAVEGGRMMVVLTASGTAPVAWRALLTVRRGDGRSYPAVLARGRTKEPWGMAGPTTFIYPTAPPTRIAVESPGGTSWSLLVAVTDGIEPTLR